VESNREIDYISVKL